MFHFSMQLSRYFHIRIDFSRLQGNFKVIFSCPRGALFGTTQATRFFNLFLFDSHFCMDLYDECSPKSFLAGHFPGSAFPTNIECTPSKMLGEQSDQMKMFSHIYCFVLLLSNITVCYYWFGARNADTVAPEKEHMVSNQPCYSQDSLLSAVQFL